MPIMRSALLTLVLVIAGCSGNDRNWKETIPVIGEVYVDGKPTEGVMITFHPNSGMDQAAPTETTAMTDAAGKFAASTYAVADGAPAGDYKLTFKLPKLNKISMTFDGDAFKGSYANPDKTDFSVQVVSGSPLDLGRIELQQ